MTFPQIITSIYSILLLSTAYSQNNWSSYYTKQMYINSSDTLFYGFNYVSDDNNLEHPLMVWLTNNSSPKRDTLPLVWMRSLNDKKWVTITPYLKRHEQWDISNNSSLRGDQLTNLINIFIERDDVFDSSTFICGYNHAGIMATILVRNSSTKINRVIAFIDDKELIKNCVAIPNVIYVMPKKFKNKTKKIKSNCYYIDAITQDEIIRLNSDRKLFW